MMESVSSFEAITFKTSVYPNMGNCIIFVQLSCVSFVFVCASRDHARGNEALVNEVPSLKVYGADDRIKGLTDKVTDSQELKVNRRRL